MLLESIKKPNDIKTVPPSQYDDLAQELAGYADAFDAIAIGAPLLTSDEAVVIQGFL